MTRAITILISPTGEEFFDSFGPITKERKEATRFVSAAVAARAANRRFGRIANAFWNSERQAEENARREFRDWSYRIEEVTD